MNNYYVYVYIDPRNNEEFYYGKGKGSRKDSHLKDQSDSSKAQRIKEIKREGLAPVIRVIARGLTQNEALLVEKTLLWKLGKWTTNISTGHFKDKFRPHNMLHRELSGFDFTNSIYYYNVGESRHRNWDDYVQFGFISAGQAKRFADAMLGFNEGDVVAAYMTGRGYVGVGKILAPAKRIIDVEIKGKKILDLPLKCKEMDDHCNDIVRSEYVCPIKWIATLPRDQGKWIKNSRLFAPQKVRASLDNQPETLKFLEQEFKIQFRKLAS